MLIIAALILTAFSLAQTSTINPTPGARTNVIVQIESGRSPNSVLSFPGFVLKREINWKTEKYIVGSVPTEDFVNVGNLPGVVRVYEDYELPLSLNQTVPLIGASQLHQLGTRGQGKSICIIDTGIDYAHPDLDGGKVVNGYDFVSGDADPFEAYGAIGSHGNWISIIAAGDGSINTGVAPDARIVAVRACTSGTCAVSNVLSGVQFCVENIENNGISIIQTEVGGAVSDVYCDADPRFPPLMTELVNQAVAEGVTVTAATGNEDNLTHIAWPACIRNSTAVASSHSRWDNTTQGNRNAITDLVAPGFVQIINPDQSPIWAGGTSISVPHVSGSIALIQDFLSQNQKYATPAEIEDALKFTGKPIQDALPPNGTGLTFKRIRAYDAAIWLRDNVGNHVPFILDFSPAQTNLNLQRGAQQTFTLSARDNDPFDALSVKWYVANVLQETENICVPGICNASFTYTFSQDGNFEVKAETSDWQATVVQTWNVTVTHQNNAPVINFFSPLGNVTMLENTQQLFIITASDADNDALSVKWFLDDNLTHQQPCQGGQQCNSSYTYQPNFFSSGVHSVRMDVSDGQASAQKQWQVTVQNVPAPDFTVLQVWKQTPKNRDPRPGERAVFGIRLKNIGETSASTIYEVNYGDGTPVFRSSSFSLGVGKTKTIGVNHRYASPGTYNLTVKVDPDNTRPELREDNNVGNLIVNVHN